MDQRSRLELEIAKSRYDLVRRIDELENRADEVRERVRHVVDMKHHIDERPLTVVGAAVGAGFVLGWLFF